jgi:hypothetical protein
MTGSTIEKLWSGYNFNNCDDCDNEGCKGRLDYDNLCSNLNYLKQYGQKNYEKNAETFAELKKLMQVEKPTIFSFGAGIALDYIGAVENFGEVVAYLPVEECEWAITKTDAYQSFEPPLPKNQFGFIDGMTLLKMVRKNAVICFFNSLFTISENTDLKEKLVSALSGKENFYFVCNYTMNSSFHLPSTEMKFIDSLIRKLRDTFSFKRHEVLGGDGVIIKGERK